MRLIDADKIPKVTIQVSGNVKVKNGECLEGIADVLYQIIEDAPTIDPESLRPRWIPVTERLPDTDKDVLVYATTKFIGGSKIAIDKLEEGEQRPIWLYTHGWFEVTHWMPLPEPPEVSE